MMQLVTLEDFLEESGHLPDLPGVKTLTPGIVCKIHNHFQTLWSIPQFEYLGTWLIEVIDEREMEGGVIYELRKYMTYYRNDPKNEDTRKTRKSLYVIRRVPEFNRSGRHGVWEISQAGILELLENPSLSILRRYASLRKLIDKKGYECLTKNNVWRWETVCKFFHTSPRAVNSYGEILRSCSWWEIQLVALKREMEESVAKQQRTKNGSPEINSDFRRFRN